MEKIEEGKEEENQEKIFDYDSLQEEITYILDTLPRSEAFDDNSMRISIFHTMLKNCELVIKFTKEYPNTPLSCQVKTRSLPLRLVEIIKKGADKKLQELAEEGKYQVLRIYDYYNELLEHNNLIPAWKEVQKAKKLLDPEKDSMKLFQKAGKVKYIIQEEDLRLALLVGIPPDYPLVPLEVTILKNNKEGTGTNINPRLLEIFSSHIQDLVRRYHLGYDGLESDLNEGKIGAEATKKVEAPLMTYEEMQYDIDFLRKQKDMKEEIGDYKKRKKYRRMIRKEAEKELEKLELEEKRIQELQANNKQARPCLVELVQFVIDKLVRYFPNAICEICGEELLSKKKKKSLTPEIAYCLHWFHSGCIEEVCNNPPFDPDCPVEGCGNKLGNKDNKTDKASVKTREKIYSQSEARKADADEIDNLFDF
ncbi:unnamed protein product [Moneuplotes crassus]|uniref:RING-type domain-containing protein n=3 Tax=Euplotes crassus TaxID=5936 RepID=A0AAD1UQN3_EUPCR|nr:unnamed protein product [Moneuplotes crassus]